MEKMERELIYSPEYKAYLETVDGRTAEKFAYVEAVMRTIKVVSSKFVKRLEGTDLYEARISVGPNEHRTIVFAIDAETFVKATRLLMLNTFLKKSTKDYKQNIATARKILDRYKRERT